MIENYKGLEIMGVYEKIKRSLGQRRIDENHCAKNSQIYRSTTAQYILQQSKFIFSDLHQLIDQLLKENASENLRRAQALISEAKTLSRKHGRDEFIEVKKKRIRVYGFTNGVVLANADLTKGVNFLDFTETIQWVGKRGVLKKNRIHCSWISDLSIYDSNCEEIAKAGRTRGKIDNETFNALKAKAIIFSIILVMVTSIYPRIWFI